MHRAHTLRAVALQVSTLTGRFSLSDWGSFSRCLWSAQYVLSPTVSPGDMHKLCEVCPQNSLGGSRPSEETRARAGEEREAECNEAAK